MKKTGDYTTQFLSGPQAEDDNYEVKLMDDNEPKRVFQHSCIFLAHATFALYLIFGVMIQKDCFVGRQHLYEEFVDNQHNHVDTPIWVVNLTDPTQSSSYQYDSAALSGRLDRSAARTMGHDLPKGDWGRCNATNAMQSLLCVDTGVFPTFRHELPTDTSLVLFSSLNHWYLILVFEWISATFALFYIPMRSKNIGTYQFLTRSAMAANAVLIIVTFVMHSRNHWDIPANNIAVGIFSLLAATGVLSIQVRNDVGGVDLRYVVLVRYLEYAITAPILMTVTLSVMSLHVPLWALQSSYLCTALCNLVGAASIYIIIYTDASDYFHVASWFFFMGSWMFFLGRVVRGFGQVPDFIKPVLVLLPLFYTAFGIVGAWLHLSLTRYEGPFDLKNASKQVGRASLAFDVFSVVIKIAIASVMLGGSSNGPASGICHVDR
jgi:hypothetical protein